MCSARSNGNWPRDDTGRRSSFSMSFAIEHTIHFVDPRHHFVEDEVNGIQCRSTYPMRLVTIQMRLNEISQLPAELL